MSTAYPVLPRPASAPRGPAVRFAGGDEAMRWYEQERVNLLRAVETAWRLVLTEPAWLLAVALARLEAVSENWPEIERLMSAALPYAERAQRPGQATTAEVRRHLASALCSSGRPEEGIAVLTRAREVCRELADRDAEARALGFLVTAYGVAGRPETGLELGVAGLAAFGDDETAGTGILLHAITRCLLRLDRPAEALGYLHTYSGRCRSLGDERGLAVGLGNTGYAYWLLGQYADAETVLAESAAVAKAAGDRLIHADSLNGIARTLQARGRVPEAWERHRQAMAVLADLPDTDAARLRDKLDTSPFAFPGRQLGGGV